MSIIEPIISNLTESQQEVVRLAREFAKTEIAPYAAEWDREKRYPEAVMRQLAELGFFGMRVPEAFGGLGLDTVTYLLVLEELAVADAATSITLSVHNSLPVSSLTAHGTEEQKRRWLPRLASGKILAAFSLSEAGAGSDAAAVRAQAVRDGDHWVLRGEKAWVTNGDRASLLVMLVRTDSPEARRGHRGMSMFLVPSDMPGVEPGRPEDKMGLRSSGTTTVALHDVRLGGEHLLGKEGDGFRYALQALDMGRMGVAAQAIGIARGALEHAVRYASEREQFGKPIKDFQAIRFKMADMVSRISASRALLFETARSVENGMQVTERASMAKLVATESAMWVTNQAVQIFGGYGYMRDYPVERLFRDAKVTEIYEGTSEVQRIVIARGLYPK